MKQLLCLIFLFASAVSFSQEEPTPAEQTAPREIVPEYKEEKIVVSDKEPEFPGGAEALYQFMSDNIQYPQPAIENGEAGRVFVQFTVETDGSLTDIKVIRGVSDALDAEALRLVKKMPLWIPGEANGKKVRVRYNLPVNFRLE